MKQNIFKLFFPFSCMKKSGCFIGCSCGDQLNLSSILFPNILSKECSNSLVTSYFPNHLEMENGL